MAKRVSSQDVARLAGVSPATVSLVLNNRQGARIPDETRQRVRAAAEALGYRPNTIARSLVSGKTLTVGVIVPGLDNSITAEVVDGVGEVCAARDHRLLLAHSNAHPAQEAERAEMLLHQRVDGVICFTTSNTYRQAPVWLEKMARAEVPVVFVSFFETGLPVDCISAEQRESARKIVTLLVRNGHRRIAYLAGDRHAVTTRLRGDGYRAALADAGIPDEEALVGGWTFEGEEARAAVERLLDFPEPPTAIFAVNDYVAFAVLAVAAERRIHVPDQLAVVGFDDARASRTVQLTTARLPSRRMGRMAAERLFERMARPDLPPESVVLPTEIVVRRTSG